MDKQIIAAYIRKLEQQNDKLKARNTQLEISCKALVRILETRAPKGSEAIN